MRIIPPDSSLDGRNSSDLLSPLFSNRDPGQRYSSLSVIQTCTVPIVVPGRDYVYKQNHCLSMTHSTRYRPPRSRAGIPLWHQLNESTRRFENEATGE